MPSQMPSQEVKERTGANDMTTLSMACYFRNGPFNFTKLSGEVRNMIYGHVIDASGLRCAAIGSKSLKNEKRPYIVLFFCKDLHPEWPSKDENDCNLVSLLRANKQIHAEFKWEALKDEPAITLMTTVYLRLMLLKLDALFLHHFARSAHSVQTIHCILDWSTVHFSMRRRVKKSRSRIGGPDWNTKAVLNHNKELGRKMDELERIHVTFECFKNFRNLRVATISGDFNPKDTGDAAGSSSSKWEEFRDDDYRERSKVTLVAGV
ncbi:hypothetical protein B0H63DRAFT_544973 [Podospora didyma]|uniref:Uncharacterized protein n=1 Tax=Podospora didyma TaxID=330526 RepID=A0AAE0NG32_9PEZI|nr:hypothetical protein B0H63DRAFT_544973 [Podospora didyma]